MTERQALLVEAYLDGSLDAEGALELARVLGAGGAAAAEIRERIAFAGLLGQALDPASPADLARSVAERLTADDESSAVARAVGRSLDRPGDTTRRRTARRPATPLPWLIAALVMVAVLATGWWTLGGRQPAQCQLSAGSAGQCDRGDRHLARRR